MFEPTCHIDGSSYIVGDNGVPRLAQWDMVLSTGLTTGGNGGDGRTSRGNPQIDYSAERFTTGLDTRYHSGGKHDATVQTDEVYENNSVPSRICNDVSLQFRATEKPALTAGVNNMFDVKRRNHPAGQQSCFRPGCRKGMICGFRFACRCWRVRA